MGKVTKKSVSACDIRGLLQHKKNFEDLFNQFYVPLVNYAFRLLHDRDAAKDIVQDVFCHLWDNRAELDITIPIQAFLYKMAYTKCISSLRHQAIIRKYAELAMTDIYFQDIIQTPESEQNLINKDLNRYITEAIEHLPPRCKEIFLLSKIEHKTQKEIAHQLDLSEKTVENQMGIALTRLRKELEWLLATLILFKYF